MWLRVVCFVLGSALTAAGVIAGFGGHRLDLMRGLIGVVFGVLFLIPALKSGSSDDLPRIIDRYYLARRLTLLGLLGSTLGYVGLRSVDRSLEPASMSDTPFGHALIWLFSILWVGGLVSSFFMVYYEDQGREAEEEEVDEEIDPAV